MKNTKQLLTNAIESIKKWVEDGFNSFAREVNEKNSYFEKKLDSELNSIKSLIKNPDLSVYAKKSELESVSKSIPDQIKKDDLVKDFYTKQEVKDILSDFKKHLNESIVHPKDGVDGKDGKDGQNGKDGVDGKSISIEDVIPAIKNLINEKFESLTMPQNGKDGKDGKDGKGVTVSDVEPLLKDLVVQQFAKIQLPSDGKDGIDGKDAIDIDILPDVDFEKSYPRGTYAYYKGGVIRSFIKTNGERGWETLWNGVHDVDIELENEKSVIVISKMTNGQEHKKRFNIPTMIYRGVYRDGEEYSKGDCVTWAGSIWHCNKNTIEKPGKNSDWTLAVKKGVDAK